MAARALHWAIAGSVPRSCAMKNAERFLFDHRELTRRYFIRLGVAGAAAVRFGTLAAGADPLAPDLAKALESLEPYFTPPESFRDVSRGKPLPHSLPDEKKREVGLTRETWKLEVISDPDNPASIRSPLTRKDGTALDFAGLMKLAEKQTGRSAFRDRPRFRRPDETCRKADRPVSEGDDLPEHRLPARHGHLGGRAAARVDRAHPAARKPAPRLLLWLSKRRSAADVPQLAAD